jgi:protein-S-isoprenylcysteine O-methyltransferase Ste14
MNNPSLLVSFSWAIFWVYWIISAMQTKNEQKANRLNSTTSRLAFFLVLLSVLFIPYFISPKHQQYVSGNLSIKILGVIIFYSGIVLAIWARRHLSTNWGLPMAKKKNLSLVTSGPYKFVRHPIYTGLLLAILGTAIVKDYSWFILLVFAVVFAVFSSLREEQYLEHKFSDRYFDYKKHTKMLIPFVF